MIHCFPLQRANFSSTSNGMPVERNVTLQHANASSSQSANASSVSVSQVTPEAFTHCPAAAGSDRFFSDRSKISAEEESVGGSTECSDTTRSMKTNRATTRFQEARNLLKLPLACIATVYAGFLGYQYYRADFQWRKALLRINIQQRRIWSSFWYDGTPRTTKTADSNAQFSTGIPVELADLVSLYFLQLDLDKTNGVRRSDILALLKNAGVENADSFPSVKNFILRGKGRSFDEQRRSGCQLQEVLELIEELLLSNETQHTSSAEEQIENDQRFAFPPLFKEQLQQQLTEYTQGALGHLLPRSTRSKDNCREVTTKQEQPLIDAVDDPGSDAVNLAILSDEKARLVTLLNHYLKLEARRGLSEAERQRIDRLQAHLIGLENDISQLSNEQALKNLEKRLHD